MRNDDLTKAIDGGVGRTLSDPPPLLPLAWRPVVAVSDGQPRKPVAIAWRDDRLLVGEVLGGTVHFITIDGPKHGEAIPLQPAEIVERPFAQVADVACNERANRILVADAGAARIYLFDIDGKPVGDAAAPPTPQGVPLLGVFAVADDGSWFDSWLGSVVNVGPYLSDADWKDVSLVRQWSPDGRQIGAFGQPRPYENRVAHRVFNRTGLAYRRGTLWVLTEADVTLRAFDEHGREAHPAVALPIYHRGAEPKISVGQRLHPTIELRSNKLAYQPNAQGLAFVGDGYLAIGRLRNWRFKFRRDFSHGFFDYWPESSVELYDLDGRLTAAFEAPGRIRRIAGGARGQLAIISESVDQRLSVLVAQMPNEVVGHQPKTNGERAEAIAHDLPT